MNLSTNIIEEKGIVRFVTAYLISFVKFVIIITKKTGCVQTIGNNMQ